MSNIWDLKEKALKGSNESLCLFVCLFVVFLNGLELVLF